MTPVDIIIAGGVAASLGTVVAYLIYRVLKGKEGPPVSAPPPEVLEAMRVIWLDLWKMDWDKRPTLYAYPAAKLNCHDGRGWMDNGRCIAGLSRSADGGTGLAQASCTVALWAGCKPHETSLVHELRHARRWLEVPMSVYEQDWVAHTSEGFQADIEAGNQHLVSLGH